MTDNATLRRRIIQALKDTEGCKTVAIVMARPDLEALLKLVPSAYEEGDDSVTLSPLDPETEEKLREQHGIDLPGWTPNRPAASPHEDALMKLYDLAVQRRVDWMHFHELAMRDPFQAERIYEELCDDVKRIVIEAGVTRGHDWRPYEPAAS